MVGQDVERPFAYGFHATPALWVFVPLAIGLAIAPHTQIAAVASFFAVLIALIFRRTLLVFLLILPLAVLYRRSFDRKDAFFDQLVGERVKVRIKVLSPLKCEISEILTDSGFAPFGARIGYSGIKLPEGTETVGEGVITEAPRWRYQMTGLHYVLDFEGSSSISPKPSFRTKVREAIKSTIEEAAWDSVNSALMTAFLLGERYEVPYELRNDFRRCGVYHLFAISGLHVGLLFTILLAITMFLRIPRRVAIALSGCVMGLYGYLVGFSPSIMRALLMLWSFTAAMIASKRVSTLNVLAFSGVLTLLLRPYYIENLGFQLSYLATFGILLYLPAINSMKGKWLRRILIPILVSLSASVFTTPLVSNKFDYISLISPISSVVLSMVLWVALAELSAFLLTGLRPFAVTANWAVGIMRLFVGYLSQFNFIALDIKFSQFVVVLWLIVVTLLGFTLRVKLTRRLLF
ncbi:MAG: hypothetical protein DRQ10_05345 [Candidatus Hydrothermota bacterium]|nr:MAG: hypothetical protein DRQ10_05345 [Candidatus Hydrothermae bacterium]